MDNSVLVITPEEKQELETDLSNLMAQGSALQVIDDESCEKGVELLSWQARAIKKVEERRQFFVKPLNDHVARINLFFKNFSIPLGNVRTIIEPKILAYRRKREQERIEAQKKLDRENKKMEKETGSPVPKPVILPQQKTTFSDSGSATAKKTWTFEIIKESDIPMKYYTLDEKKIRQAIREGVRTITGIKIFEQESLSIKA